MNKIRDFTDASDVVTVGVVHDLNLAARFADQIVLLNKGRVVASGTATDVLTADRIREVFNVGRIARFDGTCGGYSHYSTNVSGALALVEGGTDQAEVIAALVSAGIPVMAHCGLRPQSVHQLGGYKVQRDEERLLADATAAEQAGAFAVVLECIPAPLAAKITARLQVPTIGIGAGTACDGQILVTNDLLGLTSGYVPRFVKAYADTLADFPVKILVDLCRHSRSTAAASDERVVTYQLGSKNIAGKFAELRRRHATILGADADHRLGAGGRAQCGEAAGCG